MAGLGALFQTSLLAAANPEAGIGMELSAIAAVVIGGTSLMGGRGSVASQSVVSLLVRILEPSVGDEGHRKIPFHQSG